MKADLLTEWSRLYTEAGRTPPLESIEYDVSITHQSIPPPSPKDRLSKKAKKKLKQKEKDYTLCSSSNSSDSSSSSSYDDDFVEKFADLDIGHIGFKSQAKSIMKGKSSFVPMQSGSRMTSPTGKNSARNRSRSDSRDRSDRAQKHKHHSQKLSPERSKSNKAPKKLKHKPKKSRHRSPSSDSSRSSSEQSPYRKQKKSHREKKKKTKHHRSRSRDKHGRRKSRSREKHGRHHRKKRYSRSSSSSTSSSSRSRQTRGHAGIDLNSPNIRFTGSSAPPLQKRDKNSRSRKSILSGKYANTSQLVEHEQFWPHICLDRQLGGPPPDYDDMSYCQFFAGMVGKVLREIHPDTVGTHTENQLKHIFKLGTYGTNTTREAMLTMNENLFLSIEAGQLDWSNWPNIKDYHDRYMDSIRLQSGTADISRTKSEAPKKDKHFVSTDYMRKNAICFKFQNYICEHPESHILEGSNNKVLHICGLCHMSKKENVPSHGYKQCPLKKKLDGEN